MRYAGVMPAPVGFSNAKKQTQTSRVRLEGARGRDNVHYESLAEMHRRGKISHLRCPLLPCVAALLGESDKIVLAL